MIYTHHQIVAFTAPNITKLAVANKFLDIFYNEFQHGFHYTGFRKTQNCSTSIVCRYPIPNFTQICREVWKVRIETHLRL